MLRHAYYEEQQYVCAYPDGHPQNTVQYSSGEVYHSREYHNLNDNVNQIDWAIQVLSEKFGNGLKKVIMSYLDSKTSPISNVSIDEKTELETKFELYKMENIALEQRELIKNQRDQMEKMKNEISQMTNKYNENLQCIQSRFKKEIEEHKLVLDRLASYVHDKNIIMKSFSFMRRKSQQMKLRKMKEQNEKLKRKVSQIQQEIDDLICKEHETEKHIAHILNTQIDGFKDKTFNYLIEKSIIKNKDNLFHRVLVDNNTQTITRCNRSLHNQYMRRDVSAIKDIQSTPPSITIPPRTSTLTLKQRTRSSQTMVAQDILSVRSVQLSRKFCR
jgi:hypothetical protein